MTPEGKIKSEHKKYLEKSGWTVLHLMQTNKNGIPDTLVFRPTITGSGIFCFIEYKVPGHAPEPLQEFRHKLLRSQGIHVRVITSGQQHIGL